MNAVGIYLNSISDEKPERKLNEMPVLGDLEFQLATERPQVMQPPWDHSKSRTPKQKVTKSRKRSIAPLSAYCTYSQRPLSTSSKFTEFEMEELILERNLRYIKTLGYNTIRPIGIGKTMFELDQEQSGRKENALETQNASNCPPVPVENREDPYGASTVPDMMMINLDQDAQSEQEDSYNYDDEFDRVDDDSIADVRPTERLVAGTGLHADNTQYLNEDRDARDNHLTSATSSLVSETVIFDNSNGADSRSSTRSGIRLGTNSEHSYLP